MEINDRYWVVMGKTGRESQARHRRYGCNCCKDVIQFVDGRIGKKAPFGSACHVNIIPIQAVVLIHIGHDRPDEALLIITVVNITRVLVNIQTG